MSVPYHPVVALPEGAPVYDLSRGGFSPEVAISEYGIGRYLERRPGLYTTELYQGGTTAREIHIGIDLFAPVGTPVHAFDEGTVHLFGYNPSSGDYGYVLITRHELDGRPIFALHGHLSHRSVEGKRAGNPVRKGEVIAWLGEREENGGWPPHVHFQLSWREPRVHDLPGVVSEAELAQALELYPDPRRVLGPLY
jgi:murein DD-endopeptidase MepM/ murein hydrolase activator NlpD